MLVIDFHMVYNVYIIIYIYVYWLVVWNICYASSQLGIILPFDELIFFRGVGIPPTSTILMDIIYHTTRWVTYNKLHLGPSWRNSHV